MRVAGLLCWYDERPEWLAQAVAGFARVCDVIVAVDGAYALYPGARSAPRSPQEQAETILATCEAADVECLLHRPREPFWGNEVEKRNLSLALAAGLGAEWLILFDADMQVVHCDPVSVRLELCSTGANVATYALRDGMDGDSWLAGCRLIYRWTPDLRYGPRHYDVFGTYNGVTESLRDDAPATDVALRVAHPVGVRHDGRAAGMLAYATAREAFAVEAVPA